MTPEPVKRFIAAFSALPAIGPRQATRLAFYLVGQGKASIGELARALQGLTELNQCADCFNTMHAASGERCAICTNPQRHRDQIAVVEKETDLIAIEQAKKFAGRYLVLGAIAKDGMLSPGQKLRLQHLQRTIKDELGGAASEILIALNPTTYGDIDAALLVQELKPFAKKITRLGRGLPTGGEIEFADEETLGGAIDNRK